MTQSINKIADGSPARTHDLISSRSVDLVINDAKGAREISGERYKIRRAAVEANIACLTRV